MDRQKLPLPGDPFDYHTNIHLTSGPLDHQPSGGLSFVNVYVPNYAFGPRSLPHPGSSDMRRLHQVLSLFSGEEVIFSDRANFVWQLETVFSKTTGWSYYSDALVLP